MYEAKKTENQPRLKNFNLNFNFDLTYTLDATSYQSQHVVVYINQAHG